MKKAFIFLFSLFVLKTSISQTKFIVKQGYKADYSIEIPTSFSLKGSIGANIDLKYADQNGASIITTIKNLPSNVKDEQIIEMSNLTDQQVINQFEANGMENVNLIKKGIIIINGVKSYFIYYTANVDGSILYYHSINQFKNGKMINLTITFKYADKGSYMPYTFRVVNSLKHS